MTYKTIHEAIKYHEGTSLFCLSPLIGTGVLRNVFVSKNVFGMVDPPWQPGKTGSRFALSRQILDGFILGDFLTVAPRPFNKSPTAILARVSPERDEVWDFRCLDPRPGIRIFGSFGDKDVFVALTWDFRENLKRGGFAKQVRDCKNDWSLLFGNIKPHCGNSLDDYLSRPFRAV